MFNTLQEDEVDGKRAERQRGQRGVMKVDRHRGRGGGGVAGKQSGEDLGGGPQSEDDDDSIREIDYVNKYERMLSPKNLSLNSTA